MSRDEQTKLASRVEEWAARHCTGFPECPVDHAFWDAVVAGLRRAAPPEDATREAAQRYLANAFHPPQCRANRYVVSGGVTDGSLCDCGLTAARILLATGAEAP